MFYDIIVLLIFLIGMLIGVFKGAVKTLVSLLISVLSYFISSFLGNAAANWIYSSFILPSITKSVNDAVSSVDLSSVSQPIDSVISSLPGYIKAIFKLSGSDVSEALANASSSTSDAIVSAVDKSVRATIVAFLTFITVILFFFIISTVLRLTIGRLILGGFRRSSLSTIDRFLGAILGAVKSFILISFLAFIWRLILPYFTNIPQYMDQASVNSSLIFSWFYNGNIFSTLINGVLGV